MTEAISPVADAVRGNWVDRYAPAAARPYLRLSRMDRPIGTWLLLLPCWWALAAATPALDLRFLWLFVLFGIGAVVMRGAGCTFNDIADRDFDAQVARTRGRPLPSGQATVRQAVVWMLAQSLIGLAILLQLNGLAIWLGIASLGLVAIYPFAKRFTFWPQAFLGLAFNWGAIMGWAAAAGEIPLASPILYVAGIAWTLGYDTIYGHQDREDDDLIGVKSTSRLFGSDTRGWLIGFYGITWIGIGLAGWLSGTGLLFWPCLALAGAHFVWQVATLKIGDPADCLFKFRSNRDAGLIVLAGFLLGRLA